MNLRNLNLRKSKRNKLLQTVYCHTRCGGGSSHATSSQPPSEADLYTGQQLLLVCSAATPQVYAHMIHFAAAAVAAPGSTPGKDNYWFQRAAHSCCRGSRVVFAKHTVMEISAASWLLHTKWVFLTSASMLHIKKQASVL